MWQQVLTMIVRALIGDTDPSNYIYSDDRIAQSILVASLLVNQEYDFEQNNNYTYTFDLINELIVPDPVVNNDQIFMALIPLKAACLFITENYRNLVGGIVQIQDGDSEISTAGGASAYKGILSASPCQSYESLLEILIRRKIKGRAVSSPFSSFTSQNVPFGSLGIWEVRGFYDGLAGYGSF